MIARVANAGCTIRGVAVVLGSVAHDERGVAVHDDERLERFTPGEVLRVLREEVAVGIWSKECGVGERPSAEAHDVAVLALQLHQ